MDWSENHSCIKCDKGGNLLVCSENGCPLAVHERCLGCPPSLDDADRFRCPYCLYKQAVVETRKAREHALARKRALLIFMDGSEKDAGENGHHQPKSGGSNVNITSKIKSNNGGVIDQGFPVGEAERIRHAEEYSAGSKAEVPSLLMNEGNGNGVTEEKRVQEEEREASVEEEEEQIQEEQREAYVEEEEEEEEQIQEEEREASVEEEEIQQDEREASAKEEEIHEEEREASVEEEEIQEEEIEASVEKEKEEFHEEEREASADEEEDIEEEESEASYASNSQDSSFTARAKRGLKRGKPVEKEPKAVQVKSKLRKWDGKKKQAPPVVSTPTRRSARGSSSAMGTGKVVKKELVSPRKSTKPNRTPAKPASNISGRAKRQRLMWTEEEEKALREGVAKYSREKKIPWRKILEESNKFNETRTLEDLRDKWRKRSY